MSEITFNPVGSFGLVAIVMLGLLGLLWFGPDRSRTTRRQRLLLTALRGFVLLVLLFTLLRPARLLTTQTKQSATLVLLVDRSRSMQVVDALGGRSRFDSVRSLLAEAQPQFDALAEDLEINLYTFDRTVEPMPRVEGRPRLKGSPQGEQTAIGAALAEVIRRESGKRVVGVFLLSDGAQRAYAPLDLPPQIAATRLADLGYPLYTVVFGQARGQQQSRDVAIDELLVNPTVFEKNQLEVICALRAPGYDGRELTVQLLYETKPGNLEVVRAAKLLATADRKQTVRFRYTPESPGEHKLTVRAVTQPDELVVTNNAQSTFIKVLAGGLNVLYLGSGLPLEQRYVAGALAASPDVELDSRYLDARGRDRWPVDLPAEIVPGQFDVYLIGNLDSKALPPRHWQALADRVEQGAGLMMLGGAHSFGPGGFQTTGLADVLPIRMGRLERQNFGEPMSQDLHWPGPLRMQPVQRGAGIHPLLAIGPGEENLTSWRKLPPLEGANRFRGMKRGAVVLAQTAAQEPAPLLVAGSWGTGRVLAFAGDTTYRWVQEGHGEAHQRFWRQTILWLARKEESRDEQAWIKLAKRRFRPGEPVRFQVGANLHDAPDEMRFQATVQAPEGAPQPVELRRTGEQVSGTWLDALDAGDYTIRLEASHGAQPAVTAVARFVVDARDLELDNPAADPGLLAGLATATSDLGGRAIVAEELPALLREIQEHPPKLEVETQVKHTYWDNWSVLLLFIGLLSTEWYLRKRWHLV